MTFPLFNCCLYISRNDPWIVKNCALAKVEMNLLLHITWSRDQWDTWLGYWDTLTLIIKVTGRTTELNNEYIYLYIYIYIYIYYPLEQLCFITNWCSYYKLWQPLLQNRAAITNWGRYCKIGQLLQIVA